MAMRKLGKEPIIERVLAPVIWHTLEGRAMHPAEVIGTTLLLLLAHELLLRRIGGRVRERGGGRRETGRCRLPKLPPSSQGSCLQVSSLFIEFSVLFDSQCIS